MPLTLAGRIGSDTLGNLEAAAMRRYAEARCLLPIEPLGAIYLYGYSIEVRLKAAYYHVSGLGQNDMIDPFRRIAEKEIENLRIPSFPKRAPGHHLVGWATILEGARRKVPAGALPPPIADRLYEHVDRVERCWIESLRYHANKPYDIKVKVVESAARWFKTNYRTLWS
jgi:hypothetical protein